MNNKYLNKLKYKLTIIFTLLVFMLSFLLGSIFFVSKYNSSKTKDTRDFQAITRSINHGDITFEQLIGTIDLGNRLFERNRPQNKFIARNDLRDRLVNFLIIDKDGYIVYQNISSNIEGKVLESVFRNIDYNRIYEIEGFFLKVSKIRNMMGEKFDLISFKKQTYDLNSLLSDLLRFGIIALLFSIVFYIIGYAFARKNLEPIEENLKDMQNFIHNAGHELKTPISIIRGNLQIIGATKILNKDLLDEGIKEVDRLNHLIDGLVELSDIKSSVHNEYFSVYNEISDICDEFKSVAEEKGISINIKKNFDLHIDCNKDYFYIFFSNLLSNAIKYTQDGGKVTIRIDRKSFSIKDNGIGIESYNVEKIFDRFFQADKSRNNNGFGIGLSLVKKIADIYKWNIVVKSIKRKGTTFIIHI